MNILVGSQARGLLCADGSEVVGVWRARPQVQGLHFYGQERHLGRLV